MDAEYRGNLVRAAHAWLRRRSQRAIASLYHVRPEDLRRQVKLERALARQDNRATRPKQESTE